MDKQKRRQHDVAKRRLEVTKLYSRGYRKADIARKLDVDPSLITRDMQAIEAEWQKSAANHLRLARDVELDRLDQIAQEAWEAWDKSCKVGVTKKTGTSDKDGDKSETILKKQTGDPRYLAIIVSCVERRCKMLGLDSPDKLDLNAKLETVTQEVILESREDVKRMATLKEILDRAGAPQN